MAPSVIVPVYYRRLNEIFGIRYNLKKITEIEFSIKNSVCTRDCTSEDVRKPERSISERAIIARGKTIRRVQFYTAPGHYDFLRYCDILAVCPQKVGTRVASRR